MKAYCNMQNPKDQLKLTLVILIMQLFTEKKILQMERNSADGLIL